MEIVGLIILFYVCLIAVGIYFGIWRMRMAMNDPEKYKRLREAERENQDRQMEVAGKIAKGAGKAAVWVLLNVLSKRR